MPWTIDPSHSHLDFSIRHMGISTVRGRFKKFNAEIAEANSTLRGLNIAVDAASIDTGEPQRDQHLRSGDFFDVEKYPEIRFRSTAVSSRGQGRYLVSGDLKIRDTTRPVSFEVDVTDPVKDPWGNTRAAATGKGKLNRKEWGLNWNKALELGGWLVGDDVQFTFDIEAVAAASVAAR
ncbi:MAG TPA: YceI family protein [bacterium]|nr:YceI family protein [bacterium]